jgi:raffinose/stachyose/melibiose transport system permease protein
MEDLLQLIHHLVGGQLLFTDVLLVTIPPLIMFALFNRKIVSGLTAGALRG